MLTRFKVSGILTVMILLHLLILSSCLKNQDIYLPANPGLQPPYCFDCERLTQQYQDSADHPTILGEKIDNPYTIYNMTQAYRLLKGRYPDKPLKITHLYVKFSPADFKELDHLENEDIELFDYPLDRELISEGDYYTSPGKNLEDIPDYYAVVPADYHFLPGIAHSVIEKMYIPADDSELEDEALRRTNNWDEEPANIHGYPQNDEKKQQKNGILQGNPVNAQTMDCRNYPAGKILVQNKLTNDRGFRAVQHVKVVVRKLFKVERMYTDDNGEFRCKKYFRNKYTILVKFKNDLARVSRMRPWALHEQFFPIKINFGKWSNLDCLHPFLISHPSNTGTIATSHWCAAITFNGVREHRSMSTDESVGVPPPGLNIMLSSKKGSGAGNTYMLNKMLHSSIASNAGEIMIPAVLLLWSPVTAGLSFIEMEAFKARAPDIKYGYGGDAAYLTTDRYAELVYHELSHAGQYSQVGNNWWLKLGIAEYTNPGSGFYGDCCTHYSFRIALAEGWAYFMGHYLADKKWKLKSTSFPEQGNFNLGQHFLDFSNQNDISSHRYFLESYNPRRATDPDRWIPKGLFYDLCDPAIEKYPDASGINDNVSGYTVKQLYHAMKPEVETITDFKYRLLKENRDYQYAEVLKLFAAYGY